MKKILPLLEKHVQWIALALGGLYLGYMIWTYAVQTPVVVTGIAPTPLNPGDVDPYIHDSVSVKLDSAMHDTRVPAMVVPNFIDRFKADMDFSDTKQWAMDIIPDSQVLPIQLVPVSPTKNIQEAQINALPTIPPAVVADFSTGKSNIQITPAAAAPNPAQQNPVMPVANVNAPASGSKDSSWVTVSYTIPVTQIAQAFKAANIPAWTDHTTILEVHLWRQEALAGGKWSDPTQIQPINADALQPFPPANNAQQQQTFLDWAKTHISDILQPAFYPVNKGDLWHAPGEVLPAAAAVALQPLDPAQTYPADVLKQYTDDQRKAYFQAKFKLRQSQSPSNRRQPPSPPPDQPGGPFNRNTPAIGAIGTEVFAAPNMDPGPNGNPPQGFFPGAGGPDAPAPGAPATTPPDLAAKYPLPSGEFDPNTVASDITGWAHDVTAEAGHTYRYMVTYRIRNPLFGAHAANINPKLGDIFDIQSPDGQWSKAFNVASTTNFFVYANSPRGVNAARIQVYKWVNGVERSHVFQVNPGDIIGGKDGDVDYSTGWTVVDLRFDDPQNPDSTTVLVMSPEGVLDRRDYKSDQAKPERIDLDKQVTASTSADQLANRP